MTGRGPALLVSSTVTILVIMLCAAVNGRIAHHNAIRDRIYSMAATAVLDQFKEVHFILLGVDRRSADVYLHS